MSIKKINNKCNAWVDKIAQQNDKVIRTNLETRITELILNEFQQLKVLQLGPLTQFQRYQVSKLSVVQ